MRWVADTHILVWWLLEPERLSNPQADALSTVDTNNPVIVSDISLWEIAMLAEMGRIELDLPLREWLEKAVAPPFVRRAGISPAVAAEVASLPNTFHRDPADRIIVSTARVYRATLMTSDTRIIDSGLVPVES